MRNHQKEEHNVSDYDGLNNKTNDECVYDVLNSASTMMQNAFIIQQFAQKIKNQEVQPRILSEKANINLKDDTQNQDSPYHNSIKSGFKSQRHSILGVQEKTLTLPSLSKLQIRREHKNKSETVFNLKQQQFQPDSLYKQQQSLKIDETQTVVKNSQNIINQALNKEYMKFKLRQSLIKNQLMKYLNTKQIKENDEIKNKIQQKNNHLLNESKSCQNIYIEKSYVLEPPPLIHILAPENQNSQVIKIQDQSSSQKSKVILGFTTKKINEQLRQSLNKSKLYKGNNYMVQQQKSDSYIPPQISQRSNLLQVKGNNRSQPTYEEKNYQEQAINKQQNFDKSQTRIQIKNKKTHSIIRGTSSQRKLRPASPQEIADDTFTIDELQTVGTKMDQGMLLRISQVGQKSLPRLMTKQKLEQSQEKNKMSNFNESIFKQGDINQIQITEKVTSTNEQMNCSTNQNEKIIKLQRHQRNKEALKGGTDCRKNNPIQNKDIAKDNQIAYWNKDLEFIRQKDNGSNNVSPQFFNNKKLKVNLKQKIDDYSKGSKTQRTNKNYIIRSSSKRIESVKNVIDAYRDVMQIDEDHMIKYKQSQFQKPTKMFPSQMSFEQANYCQNEGEGMQIETDIEKLINKRKKLLQLQISNQLQRHDEGHNVEKVGRHVGAIH